MSIDGMDDIWMDEGKSVAQMEKELENLREQRNVSLSELMQEVERREANKSRSAMKTMAARRQSRKTGLLMPMYDANTPIWCAWREQYGQVADVMLRAETRGFFKMKDRDRNLCTKIVKERRISEKQRAWLGGISLRYLQDGVYEGHTWWSFNPATNLIVRWNKILDASTKPETTIEQLEEITGSEFMARYQKVLAAKS